MDSGDLLNTKAPPSRFPKFLYLQKYPRPYVAFSNRFRCPHVSPYSLVPSASDKDFAC